MLLEQIKKLLIEGIECDFDFASLVDQLSEEELELYMDFVDKHFTLYKK
jgi:hypothetical protein